MSICHSYVLQARLFWSFLHAINNKILNAHYGFVYLYHAAERKTLCTFTFKPHLSSSIPSTRHSQTVTDTFPPPISHKKPPFTHSNQECCFPRPSPHSLRVVLTPSLNASFIHMPTIDLIRRRKGCHGMDICCAEVGMNITA